MKAEKRRGKRAARMDKGGASVRIEFRYLNEATKSDAAAVAAWLRDVAKDLETEDLTKYAELSTRGYCRPLGQVAS